MPRGRPATSARQRARARVLQERLRAALEEQMTPEELARQADLNRRTVDKYFEGDSPHPSFFLISALAEALGLDVRELARTQADG